MVVSNSKNAPPASQAVQAGIEVARGWRIDFTKVAIQSIWN